MVFQNSMYRHCHIKICAFKLQMIPFHGPHSVTSAGNPSLSGPYWTPTSFRMLQEYFWPRNSHGIYRYMFLGTWLITSTYRISSHKTQHTNLKSSLLILWLHKAIRSRRELLCSRPCMGAEPCESISDYGRIQRWVYPLVHWCLSLRSGTVRTSATCPVEKCAF